MPTKTSAGLIGNESILAANDEQHRHEMLGILDTAHKLIARKGQDYDHWLPFYLAMPHGGASWSTLLWMKARRAVSLVNKVQASTYEPLEDTLLDIIVYAAAYLAWLRIKRENEECN